MTNRAHNTSTQLEQRVGLTVISSQSTHGEICDSFPKDRRYSIMRVYFVQRFIGMSGVAQRSVHRSQCAGHIRGIAVQARPLASIGLMVRHLSARRFTIREKHAITFRQTTIFIAGRTLDSLSRQTCICRRISSMFRCFAACVLQRLISRLMDWMARRRRRRKRRQPCGCLSYCCKRFLLTLKRLVVAWAPNTLYALAFSKQA